MSDTRPVVRFAPSPTGRLHVGNARVALVNWLFARRRGGQFILRFDDTDRARSTDLFADAIRTDLKWLGLQWDSDAVQSLRLDRYAAVLAQLKTAGRLYSCWETPEQLETKRRRQIATGRPPIYDRASLKLTDEDRSALVAAGHKPHWRFLLNAEDAKWDDLVRGPATVAAGHVSDPVLIREDGTVLYTLTSVVDDVDMGVSHVIRGEDHVTNTGAQIQLFQAMGVEPPAFGHLSLIVDRAGQGLSKRHASLSLADLREAGIEPMALNSLLAKLGTSDSVVARSSIEDLVAEFDIARFGRSPPKFDLTELEQLNARVLHEMPFETARPRLREMGIDDEGFWLALRSSLTRFDDVKLWWNICRQPLTPLIEDSGFLQIASNVLPEEPWGEDTFREWVRVLQASTGRQGRLLFHPLRLALTGRASGPDLQALLPLIGRARASARLSGKAA